MLCYAASLLRSAGGFSVNCHFGRPAEGSRRQGVPQLLLSPVSSQSTDFPNALLIAKRTAAPGSSLRVRGPKDNSEKHKFDVRIRTAACETSQPGSGQRPIFLTAVELRSLFVGPPCFASSGISTQDQSKIAILLENITMARTSLVDLGGRTKGLPRGNPFKKGQRLPFQFKPGQSGNPGGRPKSRQTMKSIYESMLAAPLLSNSVER